MGFFISVVICRGLRGDPDNLLLEVANATDKASTLQARAPRPAGANACLLFHPYSESSQQNARWFWRSLAPPSWTLSVRLNTNDNAIHQG